MPCNGRQPALSADGEKLALLIKAAQTVHAALEVEMRQRLGISGSHYDVLRALADAPGGYLRMVDIADRMCISRSGVTQSVDRLEELGLVERVANREDRRLVLAEITARGCELIPVGCEVIEAVAARFITETLSERQAAALASALAKVAVPRGQ